MENKNTFKGRLMNDVRSMSWWYGAVGSVLSTVIGIALTFGVSAWVSHRHDKQEARDMMFNVLLSAKHNKETVLFMDSIYNSAQNAVKVLYDYYDTNDGDLGKIERDTLFYYYYKLVKIQFLNFNRSKTESYFYGAETMHQFDNPEIYSKFATYVEFDKNVFEKMEDLRHQASDLDILISSKIRCEKKTYAQAISESLKDQSFFRYSANLNVAALWNDVNQYDRWYKVMMALMNATEEEVAKYEKANDFSKCIEYVDQGHE